MDVILERMGSQEKPYNLFCPKGTCSVIINEKFTGASNPAGFVRLDRRIDDVEAIRVDFAGVTLAGNQIPLANGGIVLVKSSQLGQHLSNNPYQVLDSTDLGNSRCVAVSDVIGVFSVAPSGRGGTTSMVVTSANRMLRFKNPQPVERFDWSFEAFGSGFVLNPGYACEIIITFFPRCYCKNP